MSTIAKVKSYMTPSPYTIGAEQLVAHAKELFRAHGIRHLPVLRGGSLEGVLSDRDLALIDRLDVNADRLTVDDVMTSDVYQVAPDTSLAEVAREMAGRKLGSAIVVDHHKVIGIVTTVDLCEALEELLDKRPMRH